MRTTAPSPSPRCVRLAPPAAVPLLRPKAFICLFPYRPGPPPPPPLHSAEAVLVLMSDFMPEGLRIGNDARDLMADSCAEVSAKWAV